MKSPIEMMIDKATGYDGASAVPSEETVTLRCPTCKKEKRVKGDYTDPNDCAIVEYPCPACQRAGTEEGITYFDAKGVELRSE